ncbi:amphi-Trp domain-containing protein [Haladaptatus sp. T7]|nr:amphi-Trp domain-containing protein [Haladaptatus sp. T7]
MVRGIGLITVRVVSSTMPEEVLFETEETQSRSDIADYLRTVADKLDGGEAITLTAGGQSVTLDPPSRPSFEVKAERESSASGRNELSVEFELEWKEGQDDTDGTLEIE